MTDFQDITPLYLHTEFDKGSLAALIDDPIKLDGRLIDDKSNFFIQAKLRGIEQLESALEAEVPCRPLIVVALLVECPTCFADPAEPCVEAEMGADIVPIHLERIRQAEADIAQGEAVYAAKGATLDGT